MDADIGTICVSGEGVRAGLPPLLLHRVAAKQHCANFTKHKILTKLFQIRKIRGKFREIQGKFCKTRNFQDSCLNFAKFYEI